MKIISSAALLFCVILSNASNLFAQAPANDDCTGATLISTVPFGAPCSISVSASTVGATKSSPDPSCTSTRNDDDIWYSFVANTSTIIIRYSNALNPITGGNATPSYALYDSACPTTSADIACHIINTTGNGFRIIDGLSIGETYFLRLWSINAGDVMTIDFCIQDVPAAANDECSTAIAITTEPVGSICDAAHSASTVGSTRSIPDPPCGTASSNDDIWYSFVPNTNAVRLNFSNAVQATSSSGGANLAYAIYDGTCPTSTAALGCVSNMGIGHGSELISGLTPGTTHYLRLFSVSANNYATFDFCLVDVDLPPNDDCVNAVTLTTGNGFCTTPVIGNLSEATTSAGFGAPSCAGLSGSEDVWYKLVVPSAGTVVIQTSAANPDIGDLIMEAYSGSCGSLTLLICDDDGNPESGASANHSRITLTGRTPGENIFLRILGKGSINLGHFILCAWDPSILPPVSPGGDCVSVNPVTINPTSGNQFMWVPVTDASGNIVAEIFAGGSSLETVNTSLYVNATGTVRSVNGHFYLDRNFSMETTGSGTARVRFYFTNNELNTLMGADPGITGINDLEVDRTSTPCQSEFSGTPLIIAHEATAAYGNDHYLEFPVASFSSFYIDGVSSPLPLKFLSFTVIVNSGGNILDWTVIKDLSIRNMEIERSTDGMLFRKIGTRAQSDYHTEENDQWQFSYEDLSPPAGLNFYRIKMSDVNGKTIYSQIIKVHNYVSNKPALLLFPNPAHNELWVEMANVQNENIDVQIINAAGQIEGNWRLMVSGNKFQLKTGFLGKGIFILQVRTRAVFLRTKFIKQ